jgi:site-specific DNA recombinase
MPKTAVLYARYSTDLQNERSVEDQFTLCEKYAAREGCKIVERFNDRAKSGATMFDRHGLRHLLDAAKEKPRKFDAVIVESLDRLSRDQADLAIIFRQFNFLEIKLLTVNEGVATSIHIGVRGLLGELYIKDLGDKVRRGFDGRVREGKIPGGVTYGYCPVPGKPGERTIDPKQAEIVRRIFREYADGRSPRAIAQDLTNQKVPTFTGALAWNHQTFIAGRYGTGMISNQIYIGKIVWNRRHRVKNPDTGKTIKRMAPAEDLIVTDVPHLRIVDDALWSEAQAVRSQRAVAKFGPNGKAIQRNFIPTADDLLSGMLVCGECSGRMRVINVQRDGGRRVGCAAAHMHRTCNHTKSYDLRKLRDGVLARGREFLADPEYIRETLSAFHAQFAEECKTASKDRIHATKQLTNIQVKMDRIVDAIENGDETPKLLAKRLDELEIQRASLQARLHLLEAQTKVIELRPLALDRFVSSMTKLFDTLLVSGEEDAETRALFRNVFRHIEVLPTAKCKPYMFRPYLRVGAIMAAEMLPKRRTAGEIMAEQGVAYSVSGNPGTADLPRTEHVVCLGTWRAAA